MKANLTCSFSSSSLLSFRSSSSILKEGTKTYRHLALGNTSAPRHHFYWSNTLVIHLFDFLIFFLSPLSHFIPKHVGNSRQYIMKINLTAVIGKSVQYQENEGISKSSWKREEKDIFVWMPKTLETHAQLYIICIFHKLKILRMHGFQGFFALK